MLPDLLAPPPLPPSGASPCCHLGVSASPDPSALPKTGAVLISAHRESDEAVAAAFVVVMKLQDRVFDLASSSLLMLADQACKGRVIAYILPLSASGRHFVRDVGSNLFLSGFRLVLNVLLPPRSIGINQIEPIRSCPK